MNAHKQYPFHKFCTLALITLTFGGITMSGCSANAQEKSSFHITSYQSSSFPPLYNATYISANGSMRSRDQVSLDGGITWKSSPTKAASTEVLPANFRRAPVSSFFDPSNKYFVTFFNSLDDEKIDKNIREPEEALHQYYVRYRVSTDLGSSWLFDKPVIQAGKEYSASHPMPGVFIGRNAFFLGDIGSIPIITKTGKILLPTTTTLLAGSGKDLSNPGGGYGTYTDVLVLRGKWNKDKSISWESSRVQGDPKRATRGMDEPTLIQLNDGRILMVMRGCNGGTIDKDYSLPGYKWYSYSSDDGITWSKPEPWGYDDGSPFYSPSSMSVLFRHSSGRVFWVGNISETNPKGNSPRYPLAFGEVNQSDMKLIRSSVLTVDSLKASDADKGRVDISHVSVIEDPHTHEIILVYPRNYHSYKDREWITVRIKL